MSIIKRISSRDVDFEQRLHQLLQFEATQDESVESAVTEILGAVRNRGDEALLEYTNRFDRLRVDSISELTLSSQHFRSALDGLDDTRRNALEVAASRIRAYHEKQRTQSWSFAEPDGTRLGQKITPLDRVGVYVPGGKAAYPSTDRKSVV